jgi:hypothetical protein
MSNRSTLRLPDLKRALAAVKASGLDVVRVDVDPTGKFSIIVQGEGGESATPSLLETWKARRDARPS